MNEVVRFTRGSGHVCHLFECRCEQTRLASAFLRDGLHADEACMLFTRPQSVGNWHVELDANHIDVEFERRRGTLSVIAGRRQRVDGYFNSIVHVGELFELLAARSEFAAVRILADVDWGFDPPLPSDLLCHWEATADFALCNLNVRTLCQYDVSLMPPPALCAALRAHPLVMLRQRLYRSPFFEAPQILTNEPFLNDSCADAAQVKRMLRELEERPA